MKARRHPLVAVLLAVAPLALLPGCGAGRVPPELVDARAAYAHAASGPAAATNASGLAEARRALDAAERSHAEDHGSEEARHLAYSAHRRILAVESEARAELARRRLEEARASAKAPAPDALPTLQTEREPAAGGSSSSARAAKSLAPLRAFGALTEERRGLVLTLSSSTLFASRGTSVLSSGADRLDVIARSLASAGRPVRVDVFMRGPRANDERTAEAARRRAEAVAARLIEAGFARDLVSAEGHAEDPARSAEAERVEIVVTPRAGGPDGP